MKVAVVVPIYKPHFAELQWFERISFQRCLEVFGNKYPIIFIAPEGVTFDYLPSDINYSVETFMPDYFKGRIGYNILMINPMFYARFGEFDYILIYQLDTFVFSDRLREFCRLGYDYIGAPWVLDMGTQKGKDLIAAGKGFFTVGNGGFSLRRVKSCFDILMKNVETVTSMRVTEDFVFAYLGKTFPSEFKIPPVLTASRFSVECLPERYCRKNFNVLPFGCHGWQQYSSEFYIRAFSECGYDLTPYADLMDDKDLQATALILRHFFLQRLRFRIKNGLSLKKYLPPDETFYAIVVKDSDIELIKRLFDEGLKIVNSENIPVLSNEKKIRAAAKTLKSLKVRGLLLSASDDSEILKKLLETNSWKYGRECISFWQEFQKQSTALLRRMSRPSVRRLEIISSS